MDERQHRELVGAIHRVATMIGRWGFFIFITLVNISIMYSLHNCFGGK